VACLFTLLTLSFTEEKLLIFFIFLSYHFYICSHVYTLFGPPSHPTSSRQNLFCPLVLRFCWRENIRDNKKDIEFCQFEIKIAIQRGS
jgi:hypothetical protein